MDKTASFQDRSKLQKQIRKLLSLIESDGSLTKNKDDVKGVRSVLFYTWKYCVCVCVCVWCVNINLYSILFSLVSIFNPKKRKKNLLSSSIKNWQ